MNSYPKTGTRKNQASRNLFTPKKIHRCCFSYNFGIFHKQIHVTIVCRIFWSTPGSTNNSSAWQGSWRINLIPPISWQNIQSASQFYVLCTVSEVPRLVRCSFVHRHLPSNAPLRGSSTLRGIWPIRARAALRYCFWSSRWSNELFHSLSV